MVRPPSPSPPQTDAAGLFVPLIRGIRSSILREVPRSCLIAVHRDNFFPLKKKGKDTRSIRFDSSHRLRQILSWRGRYKYFPPLFFDWKFWNKRFTRVKEHYICTSVKSIDSLYLKCHKRWWLCDISNKVARKRSEGISFILDSIHLTWRLFVYFLFIVRRARRHNVTLINIYPIKN